MEWDGDPRWFREIEVSSQKQFDASAAEIVLMVMYC